MTKEEYFKKMGSVIGLCELCQFFSLCSKQGLLKDGGGCDDFSTKEE